MSISDAFFTEFDRATKTRDFLELTKIVSNFVRTHLHPLPIQEKLDFVIEMHVNFFGGETDKIKQDLKVLTESEDIKNHYDHLLQAMIQSMPEEDLNNEDKLAIWLGGLICRIERDLMNLEQGTPVPGQTHIGMPIIQ